MVDKKYMLLKPNTKHHLWINQEAFLVTRSAYGYLLELIVILFNIWLF